ncbi:MAG TPA: SGNH/GDSL hydrolase family protein [Chitinophagaceae bacterium]|nr:SGNH/GDSL hydrolase family protein [Chitinophagaceae bacterium]
MKKIILFSLWFCSWLICHGQACSNAYRIVILGSSTAYGTGANPISDSSWVARYTRYLKSINPAYTVVNLAEGGYDTYQIQADGYLPPKGRKLPDTSRNISKALSLDPDAIIINLPSNDAAENLTQQEQKANFERVARLADKSHVPLWVTTTQPRNLSGTKLHKLVQMRDWIYSFFGKKSIDFWTGLAQASGTQIKEYGAGDGIHLNNAGHRILYLRVVSADIPDSLCARNNPR